MASLPITESAFSVFETDVMELADDPEAFGLTAKEASVRQLLCNCIHGRRLVVPVHEQSRGELADLLTELSNSYDDQAEAGVDARFNRNAARSLATLATKLQAW
jgi:hypothetical protein